MRWALPLLLCPVLLGAACGSTTSSPPAPDSRAGSQSFDEWADAFTTEWARTNPQLATRTQYFAGEEQDRLDGQLALVGEWGNPFGVAEARKWAALATRGLQELRAFDRQSFTRPQELAAAVIEWSLDAAVKNAEFADHRYVFDQFNGLQLEYANSLTQSHPIRHQRDIENYLRKLALIAPRLDEGIAEARAADAAGIRPPAFIIERTIQQIDELAKPGTANVFVTTLDQRIGALGNAIPAAERARFVDEASKIVSGSVVPAYGRVRAMLGEQAPRATDAAGVWQLPRGDAFYRRMLANYTTTSMTPDEVHALGLREVARLEAEMDPLLRQLGFTTGSLNERYEQLEQSIQPKGPGDPRPQILADNLKWVRDAEKRADRLFDLRPKAAVEVRRVPAFSEKTATAYYNDPAPDGSRPGVFWLPLPGPTFELLAARSLAYHESVPGHHFQLAVQQESTELPRFRRAGILGDNTAYTEGWGLYAERLADEDGWYANDPKGRLGYLHNMLWRARRLVVDTGIHAMKWTRQQAIDYGIKAQEVERYVVYPGQACCLHDRPVEARRAAGEGHARSGARNFPSRSSTTPC